MKRESDKSRRSPVLPLLIFFVFFYLLTHPGPPTQGDENTLLLTAESIVTRGALAVEYGERRPTIIQGGDGQYYTKLGLGQPLAEVPLLAFGRLIAPLVSAGAGQRVVFGRFVASMLPVFLVTFTVWMLHSFVLSFGYSGRTALAIAAAFGIGTMAWPYSGALLSEALQMCMLMLCAFAVCRWRNETGNWWLPVSSFALGFAITAKPAVAVVAPFVIAYVAYTMREKSRGRRDQKWVVWLALFFVPLFVWFCVNLWYNHARFGAILNLGYGWIGRDVEIGFGTPWYTGIFGLLFSTGKGIFLYSPVLVLCFFGISGFWKDHRRECLLFLGMTVSILLISARWHGWHGDYSWGPRYLLPLVPFIMIFSAPVWKNCLEAGGITRKVALVLLVLVSAGVQVLGVFVNDKKYPQLIHYFSRTQGTYRKGVNETRDDLLLNHFVPEFSPIICHAWMLKYDFLATVRGDSPGLRDQLAQSAPWLSINKTWIVRANQGENSVEEGFLGLNSWYLKWRRNMKSAPGLGKLVLLLLLVATPASAAWVFARLLCLRKSAQTDCHV